MESSNDRIGYVLEICSTKNHFYRMAYKSEDKANVAALGFLNAMRDSPPDSVAAIWEDGTVVTAEGITGIKVPVFSIRAKEIGSVCLRPVHEWTGDEDDDDEMEGETWKA